MWLWREAGGTRPHVDQTSPLQNCLHELERLIHQDHDPTWVDAAQKLQAAEKDAADASTKRSADEGSVSLNATEVLMLNTSLKMIKEHTTQANKSLLKAEKTRDELHNQIEQIEQRLHPKKARSSHDDPGDAHEMLEVEARGDRRTRGTDLKKIHGMGTKRSVLSVDNDNEFESRCEWMCVRRFGSTTYVSPQQPCKND